MFFAEAAVHQPIDLLRIDNIIVDIIGLFDIWTELVVRDFFTVCVVGIHSFFSFSAL